MLSSYSVHRADQGRPAIEVVNSFLREAPVDLEGMAAALGLVVDMDCDLPATISGKIRRVVDTQGRDRFFVDINSSHSDNRKRFTLAHEISHFLLHKELMRNGIVDNEMYRSSLGDDREYEANRLAGDLLMPTNLVKTAWRAGARSLAQLSTAFGASDAAMRIRLKQLGLGA